MDSVRVLSSVMCHYYGQKVIILINEYDMPLDKAFENGYYDSTVTLVKNVFSQALKTNESLYFAVVTRCLRITKESAFTGLNNFKVFSVTDRLYDEYYGFTDREVQEWFREAACGDRSRLGNFCAAFRRGDRGWLQ